MRASVRHDTTEWVITLEVSGVPDLDVTENWHHWPRTIRPDHVTIHLVDDRVKDLTASGPLVKRNGEPGNNRATWRLYPTGTRYQSVTLDMAPEWVRTLWREAPAGVTSWGHGAHTTEVPA